MYYIIIETNKVTLQTMHPHQKSTTPLFTLSLSPYIIIQGLLYNPSHFISAINKLMHNATNHSFFHKIYRYIKKPRVTVFLPQEIKPTTPHAIGALFAFVLALGKTNISLKNVFFHHQYKTPNNLLHIFQPPAHRYTQAWLTSSVALCLLSCGLITQYCMHKTAQLKTLQATHDKLMQQTNNNKHYEKDLSTLEQEHAAIHATHTTILKKHDTRYNPAPLIDFLSHHTPPSIVLEHVHIAPAPKNKTSHASNQPKQHKKKDHNQQYVLKNKHLTIQGISSSHKAISQFIAAFNQHYQSTSPHSLKLISAEQIKHTTKKGPGKAPRKKYIQFALEGTLVN